MGTDWPRVKQLLAEAAARNAPIERAAYLDEACRGDAPLRAEVEKLLEAHDQAGSFLEEPAMPTPQPMGDVTLPLTEQAGNKIGPYKLLQQIDEGGCGVVYMAEQEQPIRRRVALKIIKLGMDTKSVIARFEAERQALALMDHPNIATVLDAGTTDAGRPYFVMELVRGIRITDYCDQNQLSTEARLNLFIQVCHAIQHAHQKGIIHRDVKPSNILVTLNDGVPVPKVIDFGIAKATEQRLTDKTLFTAFEQFIGTPAYTSPEQAAMTSLDIDTRSDIYALGVLLYELLTGHTPFDQKELVAAGLDGMRRILREEEPARPSTRLSTLQAAERTTVAQRRQANPPQLIHLVRGDLDWIVMRCLEKDRRRRYETANSLADDIVRHLHNEPVTARPPSRLYRFQKLAQRNKATFATATVVSLALVLGLGVALWTLGKERVTRCQARAAEQKAQAEAGKSQQVARFLKDMLQGVGPSVALGRDTTMLREILDKTAERVGKDLKDQPEVEAELRMTLGEVYAALGQHAKAEAMHREALRLRQALWGNMNTNVADSLALLGFLLHQGRGELVESASLVEQALTIQTNLLGPEHVQVAATLYNLGWLRMYQGQIAEGEELFQRSLAMRRRLLGNEHLDVVQSLLGVSSALLDLRKPDQAEAAGREAMAILSRLVPDEVAKPWLASVHSILSAALRDQGKLEEAVGLARKAVTGIKRLVGSDHPDVAALLHNLANALIEANQLEEAETVIREALAVSRKTLGDQHRRTAFCLERLGGILRRTGRLAEAETAYREALAIWKNQGGENADGVRVSLVAALREQHKLDAAEDVWRELVTDAKRSGSADTLGRALFALGETLSAQGKLAEAEATLREAVALMNQLPPTENRIHGALLLVQVLLQQDRAVDAEPLLAEALQKLRQLSPSVTLSHALAILGDRHAAAGRWREAQAAHLEGLKNCRQLSPASEQRQWLASGVARALKQQAHWAEAEPFYRESLTNCATLWPNDPKRWQWQVADLAAVLQAQGKLGEAETLYHDAVTKAARFWPNDFSSWQWQFNALVDVLRHEGKTNEAERLQTEWLPGIVSQRSPASVRSP